MVSGTTFAGKIMGWLSKIFNVGGGDAVAATAEAAGKTLDSLFTSDDERLTRQEALERLRQEPAKLQALITLQEASHSSIFVAGWRPAIGWVCATSLAVYYWPRFIVSSVLWVWACYKSGGLVPAPEMGIADILGLVGTLLGMATLRTKEKVEKVAR